MTLRASALVLVSVLATAVAGSAARAGQEYPPKSHFTHEVYYGCQREQDDQNQYELDFKRNDTYRDRISKTGGAYRYIRNRGRINFQSGPVNQFFLKVVARGGGIYEYKLKRQSTGRTWGKCFPTYLPGMSVPGAPPS